MYARRPHARARSHRAHSHKNTNTRITNLHHARNRPREHAGSVQPKAELAEACAKISAEKKTLANQLAQTIKEKETLAKEKQTLEKQLAEVTKELAESKKQLAAAVSQRAVLGNSTALSCASRSPSPLPCWPHPPVLALLSSWLCADVLFFWKALLKIRSTQNG
jgi:hypothetical protein